MWKNKTTTASERKTNPLVHNCFSLHFVPHFISDPNANGVLSILLFYYKLWNKMCVCVGFPMWISGYCMPPDGGLFATSSPFFRFSLLLRSIIIEWFFVIFPPNIRCLPLNASMDVCMIKIDAKCFTALKGFDGMGERVYNTYTYVCGACVDMIKTFTKFR